VLERIRPTFFSWQSVREPFATDPYCMELLPGARRFEYGTANTVGAHALSASLELLATYGIEAISHRIRELTERLVEGLALRGYTVTSPRTESEWSGIVSFRHARHACGDILARLREAHVVASMRGSSVRLSPHFYNTPDEIDVCLEALP
jgi:cysteine desulfurase/selenocysteine lyase